MTIITGSWTNGSSGSGTWEYDYVDCVLTVKGVGEIGDYGSTNSPWKSHMSSVKKIVIGEGITRVGPYSFYSPQDTSELVLPQTLKSIGKSAFENSQKIVFVEFPASLTKIEDYAFRQGSTVDKNKRFSYAFNSTPTFGSYAVGYCGYDNSYLTNVAAYTPGFGNQSDKFHATFFGSMDGATYGSGITTTFENGVLTLSGSGAMTDFASYTPDYNKFRTTEIVMDDRITSVGKYCFYDFQKLKKVKFSSAITTIGDYAFANSSIRKMELPDSITSIGKNAFNGCSIDRLILPAGLTTLGTDVFTFDTDNVEHIVISWRNKRLSSLVTNANAMIHEFSMNDPEQDTTTYTAGTPNCTRPIMMRVFGGWKVIDSSRMIDNT